MTLSKITLPLLAYFIFTESIQTFGKNPLFCMSVCWDQGRSVRLAVKNEQWNSWGTERENERERERERERECEKGESVTLPRHIFSVGAFATHWTKKVLDATFYHFFSLDAVILESERKSSGSLPQACALTSFITAEQRAGNSYSPLLFLDRHMSTRSKMMGGWCVLCICRHEKDCCLIPYEHVNSLLGIFI
jgi:hypothetical protein